MRIVVADDSALIREGLRHLLPNHGIEIARTAADADELLEAVERTRPDVALVDIRMPPTYTIEGLAAAAAIQQRTPEVGVLVLSQTRRGGLRARASAGRSSRLRLPPEGTHHRSLDTRRGDPPHRPRRIGPRPRTRRPPPRRCASEPPQRAQRPRARGTRTGRRGPHRPRDRRTALGHAKDHRDTRPAHPRQALTARRQSAQPPRPRGPHLPPRRPPRLARPLGRGCRQMHRDDRKPLARSIGLTRPCSRTVVRPSGVRTLAQTTVECEEPSEVVRDTARRFPGGIQK